MQQHQRLTANQEALCAPLAVTRQLSSRSRSHLSSLSCCVGGAPMLVSVLLVRWAERGGERHLLLCTAAPDNSGCSIEACHPRQQLFTHQLGTLMAVCVAPAASAGAGGILLFLAASCVRRQTHQPDQHTAAAAMGSHSGSSSSRLHHV